MTNSGPSSNANDIFDVKKVRRLVELMKEHDLSEIDLKQGEQRVRLRRGYEPAVSMPMMGQPAMSHAASAPTGAGAVAPAAPAAADESHLVVVKSPMVGTFYVSPNPESPAFVKVGDRIGPESVVCIIEAMKVFNQIPAEVSGQIVSVLVDNGVPVEFGQPLFKVDPKK